MHALGSTFDGELRITAQCFLLQSNLLKYEKVGISTDKEASDDAAQENAFQTNDGYILTLPQLWLYINTFEEESRNRIKRHNNTNITREGSWSAILEEYTTHSTPH